MKGADENLEYYVSCGSIKNACDLVIVGFNVFNRGMGKKSDITISGDVFLGICI